MIQQKYNLSLPKVIALDELEQVVTDLWKPDDNNKNNSLIGWLLFTVCVADILGNIRGEPTITGWITYWIYTVLEPGEHDNKYKILAIGIQMIEFLIFVNVAITRFTGTIQLNLLVFIMDLKRFNQQTHFKQQSNKWNTTKTINVDMLLMYSSKLP